jgi:hypothetical protein
MLLGESELVEHIGHQAESLRDVRWTVEGTEQNGGR